MATDKVAVREPIALDKGGVQLRTLEDAFRFATAVVNSGVAPKGDTPEAVVVKLQAGRELGFSPMQALASLTAINGRIGLMGTAALALVRASGLLEPGTNIRTWVEGEGDKRTAHVESQRAGAGEPVRHSYGVPDAKRAGLWGKAGPWSNDPDAMLTWRAVSRHAKLEWSDVLLGLDVSESVADYAVPVQGTARVVPEPPAAPDPLLGVPFDPPPTFDSPKALLDECLRRTGGDEDAARDLCRDVCGTRFPETIRPDETVLRDAAKKLVEHPIFGGPADAQA